MVNVLCSGMQDSDNICNIDKIFVNIFILLRMNIMQKRRVKTGKYQMGESQGKRKNVDIFSIPYG